MIYIKTKEKPKTLSELINKLFDYLDSETFKSVATYSNEECTILECDDDKFRSADDFIEIAKTYFPQLSDKIIFNTLMRHRMHKGGKYLRLRMIECMKIKKPTICFVRGNKISTHGNPESDLLTESKYRNWRNIAKIAEHEI